MQQSPYISIYDIPRAGVDKARVPIYYESHIFKLALNAAELPKLDAECEEITEGEQPTKKEKLKTKWAALEALMGDPIRIASVRDTQVYHLRYLSNRSQQNRQQNNTGMGVASSEKFSRIVLENHQQMPDSIGG